MVRYPDLGRAAAQQGILVNPVKATRGGTSLRLDRIAQLLALPELDDVIEMNADYIGEVTAAAEEAGQEWEEASRAAENEVVDQWQEGVLAAANDIFGHHGLELEEKPVRGGSRPWEYRIVPVTSWADAANRIRTTISGVGLFEFDTLAEFLSSGPYTPQQAVLSHLHQMRAYPEVYGTSSARRLYEGGFRRNPEGTAGQCDKCRAEATGEVTCTECPRVYRRCLAHGGAEGAKRSLHSHAALYHTKKYGRNPPPGLTAKGARMYAATKSGYEGEPRAKEIAARTVRARAGEGVPGLVRGNGGRRRNPVDIDELLDKAAIAGDPNFHRRLWLFQFGAYGTTWVAVWEDTLEDALEAAGEYLAEHAPGHIMAMDDPHLRELQKEAEEEGKPDEWDADLTYTESGYLTSYEWWVDEVSRKDPRYRPLRERGLATAAEDYIDDVLAGMAEGLWVMAYANFIDEERSAGKTREELEDAGYATAGAGDDWMDVAPELPQGADQAAVALAESYATANGADGRDAFIAAYLAKAITADELGGKRRDYETLRDDDAVSFGQDLAFMALGSGASWFDNHAEFPLEQPNFETNYDGQQYFWSGGPRGNR